MTDIRAQLRRQIELEEEGRALGASRYRARALPWKTDAGSIEEEANLPPGRQLLKALIEPTAAAISAFLEAACSGKAGRRHQAADFLLLTDPLEVAYLACRVLINATVSANTLQNTAIQVADAVIDNLEMKAFKEMNKDGYKGYLKAQEKRGYSRQRRAAVQKLLVNEGARIEVAKNDRVVIGTKIIELVVESTGMFEIEKSPKARGWLYVVRPVGALQKWLDDQHARCELLDPILMPMLVRPRRWRSPSHGGYLTRRPGNRLIKQRNRAYHDEVRNMDLTRVYDAVNHIQDSPWAINTRVLEVMEGVWVSGGQLGGLPKREPEEVPAKPFDIETNEAAKTKWKRDAAQVYARNAAMVSSRIAMHQRLWLARKFSTEPRMFFPHELDFRGRVYPMSSSLTPQGDDTAKALLMFADGMPLGDKGALWLAIHISNLFGVDKVSLQDRLAWTWEHSEQIVASAQDPYAERFWETADSPYCALAACFEWQGYIEQGEGFVSHLPIALDGSCSGLQHFSAMLRDPVGGAAVNLTRSEKPQDVYTQVAKKAQEMADASADEYARKWPQLVGKKSRVGEDEVDLDGLRHAWANNLVSRTIAKRPTMTYCYSATRFGMQKMILQTLNELDKEREKKGQEPYLGGVENYHAASWLSYAMWEAISEVVVAASTAMEWLRDVAKVAADGDLPIWWTSPIGLPILQEYKTVTGTRVKAHWAGQRVDLVINAETDGLDKRAQSNGIAPNFVHSLDASHLMAVALRAKEKGIRSLAVIHDSFGTHAANTDLLGDILRETFIEQYQPDVLGRFYEELKEQLPEELGALLPLPPKAGTLDLNEVRASSYIFA